MSVYVNAPVLSSMAGEMSLLSAARPVSPPDSAAACGSAAVARALAEFSEARTRALTSLIDELAKLSDGLSGTLADAQQQETEKVESLRTFEKALGAE